MLLIGIRPEKIKGIELAYKVRTKLDEAEAIKVSWRETYDNWNEAKPIYEALREEAYKLMPPVASE